MTLAERGRLILTETRSCLTKPERWTQSVFARTATGEDCAPTYNKATCFCLLGALTRAMYKLDTMQPGTPLDWSLARGRAKAQIRRVLNVTFIAKWQDDPKRTHADILNALDAALGL